MLMLGGIKSRPDPRDYPYTPRRAGLLGLAPPRQIDRSGALPPCWNQGPIGSCEAHAGAAKLWELYPGYQASRLALYYTGRKLEGRIGQEGMETRDTMKVLQAGVIPESAWPYDLSKVDAPPPSESERRFIGSYARIQGESDLIDHLAHDGCVVLSFNVPDSFMANGTFIPATLQGAGWHCVLAVGYDLDHDTGPSIFVRNSWGDQWGPVGNGHFWMPIAWAVGTDTGDDMWTPHYAPPGTVAGVVIEPA